jgi:hypothetical protein
MKVMTSFYSLFHKYIMTVTTMELCIPVEYIYFSNQVLVNLHSPMVYTHVYLQVGFEVLTAVSTNMAIFWVVAPCSLVEVYQCKLLVNFYQTTWRYNPEDSHLYVHL